MFVCVCECVCIYMQVHAHNNECTCLCVHECRYDNIVACVYVCVCMLVCTCFMCACLSMLLYKYNAQYDYSIKCCPSNSLQVTYTEFLIASLGSLAYAEDDNRHILGLKAVRQLPDGGTTEEMDGSSYCCHVVECDSEVCWKIEVLTVIVSLYWCLITGGCTSDMLNS